MRFLCLLFLALFTIAVGAFAFYNQDSVTLKFWDYQLSAPMAAVVGVTYVVGMLSGWTVVGMLRRSAGSVMKGVERQFNRHPERV
jgi:uncharacterized membrane protein YciS (DUF1049 family)